MPIYEPNEATDLAIRSLLDQTWRNLEVIIVDDASPALGPDGEPTPYRRQLEGWAEADSRVLVHFAQENRGAYSVRNDGLDMATGEFVTIADKDDWHHPQKFEFQASYLMENPDQVATMTNWVRVDPEMKFLIRSGTGKIVYQSFASLMFRREPVMEKLGYWDAVRKGGDAEFRARLEAVFGQEIWPAWQPPMAFSLLGTDNLTSADMGAGYLSPDRRAYSRAYKPGISRSLRENLTRTCRSSRRAGASWHPRASFRNVPPWAHPTSMWFSCLSSASWQATPHPCARRSRSLWTTA